MFYHGTKHEVVISDTIKIMGMGWVGYVALNIGIRKSYKILTEKKIKCLRKKICRWEDNIEI